MQKQFTYEVIGEIRFSDSFDWQAQADEWWHGDLDEMLEALALFMIGEDTTADRWEGADIPSDAAVLVGGQDWSHGLTEDVAETGHG